MHIIFVLFEMNGMDVILGTVWLEALWKITVDWKKQVMKFKLGYQVVKLIGDLILRKTLILLKAMLRTI